MNGPELPDMTEYFSQGVVVPDTIALAVNIERRERKRDFGRLRSEIERVKIFGANDNDERSYHVLPKEDGTMKVLFESTNRQYVGKCYRVVVNEEFTDIDDGRSLYIYDYIVAAQADLITRGYSVLSRGQHDHSWHDIDDSHGPIIARIDGVIKKYSGKDYEPLIPSSDARCFEEVLWRRDDVNDLFEVLTLLNDVSCEDIIG